MIVFVTSLRHPRNSDSYERVETLLKATLDSVGAQIDQQFEIVIVGNQAPGFALPARTHFVQVDYPPPVKTPGPRTPLQPFVWDKGTKIGIGLIYARRFQPDHVMIFDADDFVSNRIAGFANANKDSPGWVVSEGWMYSGTRKVFRKITNFNKTCGTCFVLPFAAYGVPETLDVNATQQDVAAAYGEKLHRILGAHRDALEWHRTNGRSLQALPFRGAVYHVDTGENHSGKTLEGFARPSTASLRREFGIPDTLTPLSAIRRAVQVGGPRVALRSLARTLRGVIGIAVRRRVRS